MSRKVISSDSKGEKFYSTADGDRPDRQTVYHREYSGLGCTRASHEVKGETYNPETGETRSSGSGGK